MTQSTINDLQLEQLCLLIELEIMGKSTPTQKQLNEVTERIGLEIGLNQKQIPAYQRAVECEIPFLLELGTPIQAGETA